MGSDDIVLDMHIHSHYSLDSLLSLRTIHKRSFRAEITPIICDHNTIRGSADYFQNNYYFNEEISPIVAEEIQTTDGEIIGLFLNEEILPYQLGEVTLDIIRDQGALAIIPHPGDRFRKSAMRYGTISTYVTKVHALEAFNSRTLSSEDVDRAEKFALNNNLSITGGSDAHTPMELFRTTIRVQPFDSPNSFLKNLRQAKIQYRKSDPFVHLASVIAKRVRR